jgi:hypothetical protein
MDPECEDPPVSGINLRIIQLDGEGTVRATRPRVQSHYHCPPSEWLNAAADEGPSEVRTHQLGVEQLPYNIV